MVAGMGWAAVQGWLWPVSAAHGGCAGEGAVHRGYAYRACADKGLCRGRAFVLHVPVTQARKGRCVSLSLCLRSISVFEDICLGDLRVRGHKISTGIT